MADTLFCLDIHKETIAAVMVDRSAKVSRVVGCGFADLKIQSYEDAIVEIKQHTGFTGGPSLVTFGAELFSFRNLSLPFTDRKKIEQILPFELAELSPIDISGQIVDFIIAKADEQGADIVAALLSRQYLGDWFAVLQAAGINPDNIGISGLSTAAKIAAEEPGNFLLIDFGKNWATLFVVIDRKVRLIRSLTCKTDDSGQAIIDDTFILHAQQTMLASQLLDLRRPNYRVFITGAAMKAQQSMTNLSNGLGGVAISKYLQSTLPFVKIDPAVQSHYRPELMGRVLALALKGGRAGEEFNFRKNEFKKRKTLTEYRGLLVKAAVPAAVTCILLALFLGYGYSKLLSRQVQLQEQITAIFRETLPEVSRIVNPVQQLQVVNNDIKATYRTGGDGGDMYTVVELLAELSARIPQSYALKIVRLVIDADTLRLRGETGDFNTVDNVQKELEKSNYFKDVTISSANQSPRGDSVNFELRIVLVNQ
ncbi:MAG: type II secretion system protein GspL [Desulforhopalus sp.]